VGEEREKPQENNRLVPRLRQVKGFVREEAYYLLTKVSQRGEGEEYHIVTRKGSRDGPLDPVNNITQ